MGLRQHVSFCTHIAGNSLDLVITEATNGVNVISCEPGHFVSDHCSAKVVIVVDKETISSKSLTFRDFKNVDSEAFAKAI